jgi:hypothetical protein
LVVGAFVVGDLVVGDFVVPPPAGTSFSAG